MILKPPMRRIVAVILIVLGAVLMLLAPDAVWQGALLLALGIALELLGIWLEHVRDKSSG